MVKNNGRVNRSYITNAHIKNISYTPDIQYIVSYIIFFLHNIMQKKILRQFMIIEFPVKFRVSVHCHFWTIKFLVKLLTNLGPLWPDSFYSLISVSTLKTQYGSGSSPQDCFLQLHMAALTSTLQGIRNRNGGSGTLCTSALN